MSRWEMWSDRRHDERGIVLPTRITALGLSAVVAGALALAFVGGPDGSGEKLAAAPSAKRVTASPTTSTPSASPTRLRVAKVQPTLQAKPKPKPKPTPEPTPEPLDRGDYYVEVYNNSGITGLAAATGARAQSLGWGVVGEDNWYGTISSSTVYYGYGMYDAAKQLASDLGIYRILPAIAPMRGDRLTVILTADYG